MKLTRQLLIMAAGGPLLFAGSLAQGHPDRPKKEAAKVEEIPLSSVYSTNSQEGLQPVKKSHEVPYAKDMLPMFSAEGIGPSNIFLVLGKDIVGAVKATRRVLMAGQAADKPVLPKAGSKERDCWLVAYLGTSGSDPPHWLVQSVKRKGQTLRLTYSEPGSSTNDSFRYFVWVRLGKLKAGQYTLEMFNAEKNEVALLRRVTIPK